MGLDFTLYEVKKLDDKRFEVSEVYYLSNRKANVLCNYLYRNHHEETDSDYLLYKRIHSEDLDSLFLTIQKVLGFTGVERDLKAIIYLAPKTLVIDDLTTIEPLTKEYYNALKEIMKELYDLLYDEEGYLIDKEFVYNINW